jgi:hypothetical protein
MPAYLFFNGIVKEILQQAQRSVKFKCQVNLGNSMGEVVVSSFSTYRILDEVDVDYIINVHGSFICENGQISVRANQLTVIADGDLDIRPATFCALRGSLQRVASF